MSVGHHCAATAAESQLDSSGSATAELLIQSVWRIWSVPSPAKGFGLANSAAAHGDRPLLCLMLHLYL